MKPSLAAFAAAAALALAAPASHAIVYVTTLSPGAEVPPVVGSTGSGNASVDFDLASHTMKVNITFAGLVAPTTVAHIHCCVDTTGFAGVATTTPTFPGFPAGVTGGSYSQSFDTLAVATYSAGFLGANGGTPAGAQAALKAALDGGLAYVNVHSSLFPAGEVRGQLTPIPEPSSLALTAVGIGLLGFALRRRLHRD